jgi:hypothetical protein
MAYADTMAPGRSAARSSAAALARLVEQPWNAAQVALALVVIVAMTVGPWAARLGAELRTWTLAYTGYLILVDAPSTSLFRHLLPLFPLVVVAIGGGWKDRPPARWGGGPCS